MYGKSYDAVTGLIGVDQQPAGPRRGRLPGAGLRRLPLPLRRRHAPRERARHPGALRRDRRHAGPARRRPGLQRQRRDDTQPRAAWRPNYAAQASNDDHDSAFWKQRNLIPGAKGSNVPLFLTQGLTENNTVADGTAQYLREPHRLRARLARPVGARARQRDSDRRQAGRLKMGRAGWFDEVMRFYDRFLKGTSRRSTTRRSRSRPTTASGAPSRAGRRPTRRRTRRRCARAPTPTTAPADATGRRRARRASGRSRQPLAHAVHLSGSGERQGQRHDDAAQRQPRGRRLRPRRERHRAADHAPGPPGPQARGRSDARPVVGRLEVPGRPPHRRQGHRQQRRLVGARADQADGHGRAAARSRCRSCPPRATTGTIQGDPGTQLAGYLSETVTVPQATLDSSTAPGFATP